MRANWIFSFLTRSALVAALLLPSLPLVADETNEALEIAWEFSAPAYSLRTDAAGKARIELPGFTQVDVAGEWRLPRQVQTLALPPQADLGSLWLEVVSKEVERLPGSYQAPLILPDRADTTEETEVMATGPGAMESSAYVRLLGSGQMRKWRFVRLEYRPFYYTAQSGQLDLVRRVRVRLHYRLEPASDRLSLLHDRLFDDLAAEQFANYAQVQAWYTPQDTPSAPAVTYDYVIITTNAIETNSTKLDDFILHKQNLGFQVLTITQDEYGGLTGQAPNGTAEKIREWLINNYLTYGIKYVLLIGNPDPDDPSSGSDTIGDVPMKMCWPRRTATDSYKEAPTDYFYADLTGNWDLEPGRRPVLWRVDG